MPLVTLVPPHFKGGQKNNHFKLQRRFLQGIR
nr:MAG TPA_asm: hypothetical protein [Caudoviricetes sp.]